MIALPSQPSASTQTTISTGKVIQTGIFFAFENRARGVKININRMAMAIGRITEVKVFRITAASAKPSGVVRPLEAACL